MKIVKECTVVVKIELSGEDLECFKMAVERVLFAEKTNNLGLGILKEDQKEMFKKILNEIKE